MPDLVDELNLVPEEAVAVLRDVSISALRNERAKGIGPTFVKLGRSVYYPKAGLLDYIKQHTIKPINAPTLTSGRGAHKQKLSASTRKEARRAATA